jgi:hypothetical protein
MAASLQDQTQLKLDLFAERDMVSARTTEAGTTLDEDATALAAQAFGEDHSEIELDGFWRVEIARRSSANTLEADVGSTDIVAELLRPLFNGVAILADMVMGSDESLQRETIGPHPMLGCEVMPEQFYDDGEVDATVYETLGPQAMLACEAF